MKEQWDKIKILVQKKQEQLKQFFINRSQNANRQAKQEQTVIAVVIGCFCLVIYGGYLYTSKQKTRDINKQQEITFDGTFDNKFNRDNDEAILLNQQKTIDELASRFKKTEELLNNTNKKTVAGQDEQTKQIIQALREKIDKIEQENQQINQQLQVAMVSGQSKSLGTKSLTQEDIEENFRQKAAEKKAYYRKAGLQTVRFTPKKTHTEDRRPDNYVWAGTFVSGIMLTGVMGDAGVNGQKNTGTVLIRLDDNGNMPNGKRSRLKDCFVLGSSYGDLSGDSVVIHTETLSCASRELNFEIKVYGSVYDQDAMQDVRGTPILKTKPLLEYTAAAGLIAGVGDGLANYGSIQSINPDGSLSRISPSSIGRMGAGGAISNPANKVSEYIMKIADIYHPLVVARAGRRVSVMFVKGFWIDKAHQKFESGKSIDNEQAQLDEKPVTTTITRVNSSYVPESDSINQEVFARINQEIAQKQQDVLPLEQNAEQAFLKQKGFEQKPMFSESSRGETR